MTSRFGKVAMLAVGVLMSAMSFNLGPAKGQAGGGDPGSGEEGQIVHNCEAASPTPQSRTDIGIGEVVDLSIDPSQIFGTDDCWVSWSISGSGTLSSISGTTTTYTADLASSNYSATITATVAPNIWLADAQPVQIVIAQVQAPQVRQVQLNAKVPTGYTFAFNHDAVNYGGTKGPPNNKMGAESYFDCWVTPANVSFANVDFRENIAESVVTWPDGSKETFYAGGKQVPYNVGPDANGKANCTSDDVATGLEAIGKIQGKAFSYTITVPEDFQDGAGNWHNFLNNEAHKRSFTAAGVTSVSINTSAGGGQGPWQ